MSRSQMYFWGGVTVGLIMTAFVTHAPEHSSDWASWVQAVGSIAAIIGAFSISRIGIKASEEQRARNEEEGKVTDLLAIQQVCSQLRQMCMLTQYEKSNGKEGEIYPDAAMEFDAVAMILSDFPPVRMAAIGELETLFRLRRISQMCAKCFRADQDLKGDPFVLKYRSKFDPWQSECMKTSLRLAERITEAGLPHLSAQIIRHL